MDLQFIYMVVNDKGETEPVILSDRNGESRLMNVNEPYVERLNPGCGSGRPVQIRNEYGDCVEATQLTDYHYFVDENNQVVPIPPGSIVQGEFEDEEIIEDNVDDESQVDVTTNGAKQHQICMTETVESNSSLYTDIKEVVFPEVMSSYTDADFIQSTSIEQDAGNISELVDLEVAEMTTTIDSTVNHSIDDDEKDTDRLMITDLEQGNEVETIFTQDGYEIEEEVVSLQICEPVFVTQKSNDSTKHSRKSDPGSHLFSSEDEMEAQISKDNISFDVEYLERTPSKKTRKKRTSGVRGDMQAEEVLEKPSNKNIKISKSPSPHVSSVDMLPKKCSSRGRPRGLVARKTALDMLHGEAKTSPKKHMIGSESDSETDVVKSQPIKTTSSKKKTLKTAAEIDSKKDVSESNVTSSSSHDLPPQDTMENVNDVEEGYNQLTIPLGQPVSPVPHQVQIDAPVKRKRGRPIKSQPETKEKVKLKTTDEEDLHQPSSHNQVGEHNEKLILMKEEEKKIQSETSSLIDVETEEYNGDGLTTVTASEINLKAKTVCVSDKATDDTDVHSEPNEKKSKERKSSKGSRKKKSGGSKEIEESVCHSEESSRERKEKERTAIKSMDIEINLNELQATAKDNYGKAALNERKGEEIVLLNETETKTSIVSPTVNKKVESKVDISMQKLEADDSAIKTKIPKKRGRKSKKALQEDHNEDIIKSDLLIKDDETSRIIEFHHEELKTQMESSEQSTENNDDTTLRTDEKQKNVKENVEMDNQIETSDGVSTKSVKHHEIDNLSKEDEKEEALMIVAEDEELNVDYPHNDESAHDDGDGNIEGYNGSIHDDDDGHQEAGCLDDGEDAVNDMMLELQTSINEADEDEDFSEDDLNRDIIFTSGTSDLPEVKKRNSVMSIVNELINSLLRRTLDKVDEENEKMEKKAVDVSLNNLDRKTMLQIVKELESTTEKLRAELSMEKGTLNVMRGKTGWFNPNSEQRIQRIVTSKMKKILAVDRELDERTCNLKVKNAVLLRKERQLLEREKDIEKSRMLLELEREEFEEMRKNFNKEKRLIRKERELLLKKKNMKTNLTSKEEVTVRPAAAAAAAAAEVLVPQRQVKERPNLFEELSAIIETDNSIAILKAEKPGTPAVQQVSSSDDQHPSKMVEQDAKYDVITEPNNAVEFQHTLESELDEKNDNEEDANNSTTSSSVLKGKKELLRRFEADEQMESGSPEKKKFKKSQDILKTSELSSSSYTNKNLKKLESTKKSKYSDSSYSSSSSLSKKLHLSDTPFLTTKKSTDHFITPPTTNSSKRRTNHSDKLSVTSSSKKFFDHFDMSSVNPNSSKMKSGDPDKLHSDTPQATSSKKKSDQSNTLATASQSSKKKSDKLRATNKSSKKKINHAETLAASNPSSQKKSDHSNTPDGAIPSKKMLDHSLPGVSLSEEKLKENKSINASSSSSSDSTFERSKVHMMKTLTVDMGVDVSACHVGTKHILVHETDQDKNLTSVVSPKSKKQHLDITAREETSHQSSQDDNAGQSIDKKKKDYKLRKRVI